MEELLTLLRISDTTLHNCFTYAILSNPIKPQVRAVKTSRPDAHSSFVGHVNAPAR